jgi:hypothetical protein
MSAATVEAALDAMRNAVGLYARQRRGFKPALWRLSDRRAAPVKPESLLRFLRDRIDSSAARKLAMEVLAADLAGFPVITDQLEELV